MSDTSKKGCWHLPFPDIDTEFEFRVVPYVPAEWPEGQGISRRIRKDPEIEKRIREWASQHQRLMEGAKA